MNFYIFQSASKSIAENPPESDSKISSGPSSLSFTPANRKSWLNSLIVLTGAIANGMILFYPVQGFSNPVFSASPTVLPPLTESAKAHYTAELERYGKQLQNVHTQQDHRAIADTLAHLGCREAATRQYEIAMSHGLTAHSHAAVPACNLQK